jgi:hypothetical protein
MGRGLPAGVPGVKPENLGPGVVVADLGCSRNAAMELEILRITK